VNRFCSIFSQLLQLFPRLEFQQVVRETKAERHARGFTCWTQFVAMLFCQLGRANSLREICGGLASCEGKLSHLGIRVPKRSTLAYANGHRPWELYEATFHRLLNRCRTLTVGRRRKPFRFKNPLLSLDASVIDLCATVFDWARFVRTKGAVKLHLLLDHDGYLPAFACITEGAVADLTVARQLNLAPGTIAVFDRGFTDYDWYADLTDGGVFFVTRLKSNADYAVLRELPVPENSGVVRDQVISLYGLMHRNRKRRFRLVEIEDPVQGRLVFPTNHLRLAATTIASIYRERWQIELFFRALKQNLKVKTFVGVTPNALKTQIWTALIAMLILRFLQLKSAYDWSLSNLAALLRMNLFVHRDLWTWLNEPFESPPELPEATQATFSFA
jgi:hypothetical protein